MRLSLAAASLVSLVVVGACTEAPECTYSPTRTPNLTGRAVDQSEVPMLPDNPYWVSNDPSLPPLGSSADPCAGQPGHPARPRS
jgi:hypothetical protein